MRAISKIATWAIMSLCVIQASAVEARVRDHRHDPQLLCMAKNIYYEAGLEGREGMMAVAQVTMNRIEADKFPKTVCGVVNQKTQIKTLINDKPVVKTVCQFSWVCNPPAPISFVSDRWHESLKIATEVMYRGSTLEYAFMTQALYFHNTKVNPKWGLAKLGRIGGHIFYSDEPVRRKK